MGIRNLQKSVSVATVVTALKMRCLVGLFREGIWYLCLLKQGNGGVMEQLFERLSHPRGVLPVCSLRQDCCGSVDFVDDK